MKIIVSCAMALFATAAFAGPSDKLAYVGSSNSSGTTVTPNAASADAPTAKDGGPLSDLADLFASDFASAKALATSTSIQDGNGAACWGAFGPFGEIIKAHPKAFTGKLATDIEAQRLEVIAARGLCDNVACQTVFTEAATAVSKLASTLPISINVNVTPINLFAKACADVPNIVVVAPSVAAAEAPAAPVMVPVVKATPKPTTTPTPTPSAP